MGATLYRGGHFTKKNKQKKEFLVLLSLESGPLIIIKSQENVSVCEGPSSSLSWVPWKQLSPVGGDPWGQGRCPSLSVRSGPLLSTLLPWHLPRPRCAPSLLFRRMPTDSRGKRSFYLNHFPFWNLQLVAIFKFPNRNYRASPEVAGIGVAILAL